MFAFVINAAAAAFNFGMYELAGHNPVALICALFSTVLALGFLLWEISR